MTCSPTDISFKRWSHLDIRLWLAVTYVTKGHVLWQLTVQWTIAYSFMKMHLVNTPSYMYKYLYETNKNNSSSNHLFILHFTLTCYQHCALRKNKAKKNNTLQVLFTAGWTQTLSSLIPNTSKMDSTQLNPIDRSQEQNILRQRACVPIYYSCQYNRTAVLVQRR